MKNTILRRTVVCPSVTILAVVSAILLTSYQKCDEEWEVSQSHGMNFSKNTQKATSIIYLH